MSYWIRIFNQQPIVKITPVIVRAAITASNFHTLCEQYQVDQELIQPTLANLEIIQTSEDLPILFLLRYHQDDGYPIWVYQWNVSGQPGEEMLDAALERAEVSEVRLSLANIAYIVAVELLESQLQDLGLLLGYEIARWAGDQGKGIVYGLDREWYRLNGNLAFIPIRSD